MRRFRASAFALTLALTSGECACGGTRGPAPAELKPFANRPAPHAPLPDDLERAAGRLAALALSDQQDLAAEVLAGMRQRESEREAEGLAPSGLIDNAVDLTNAMAALPTYTELATQLLDEESPDPTLTARLEHHLESQPLAVADRRLKEDRYRKIGGVFNRLVAPISRFFIGGVLPALETGRAALASLLIMRAVPEATVKERQALRAYQEFLARNPDSPEREWVEAQIRKYDEQLRHQLHAEAIEAAKRALRVVQPEAALAHLDRAARLIPDDPEEQRWRVLCLALKEKREAAIRSTFEASFVIGVPLDLEAGVELEQLAYTILVAPADEISRHATAWQVRHEPGRLADELDFLEAYWYLAKADEDSFFRTLEKVRRMDAPHTSMARHAAWILADPAQNPYAAYRKARREDRAQRLRWLFLGRRGSGALRRGLWRPLEWILDLPGIAVSLLTTPVRILQYPGTRPRFGGGVLHAGERYLARFPSGNHSLEIHRELEGLYGIRQHWSQALVHHRARPEPDPKRIQSYRENIAERTLGAARMQRRLDVRVSIYRSVLQEYTDTRAATLAKEELRELIVTASPQHIRLSKSFLEDHPELWGIRGLGIRKELLDGEKDNGEIAEEGLTLVGRTVVRISLEGRESVLKEIPPERFAYFIAALEEASYRELRTDPREVPRPDPQLELFFERARLGLLQTADVRPAARSDAEFLSSSEKYGRIRRRDSILPVELVLRGGLEDFGFAAYPRLRLPGETPDSFLYR